jgi:hypothetical protein
MYGGSPNAITCPHHEIYPRPDGPTANIPGSLHSNNQLNHSISILYDENCIEKRKAKRRVKGRAKWPGRV